MTPFRNSYYLMRHGQSETNVAGIVVSTVAAGTTGYGLTAAGECQVISSLAQFSGPRPSRVVSSDFLRARQTATLAAAYFELPEPVLEQGLRERFFGRWDGQADSGYAEVWALDAAKIEGAGEVEPVAAVLQRALDVLHALEARYTGEVLLLVSHGDLLQILQAAFAGLVAAEHRSVAHHQTAEIRLLVQVGDRL
jgi:probable phosphoglycerate mutase